MVLLYKVETDRKVSAGKEGTYSHHRPYLSHHRHLDRVDLDSLVFFCKGDSYIFDPLGVYRHSKGPAMETWSGMAW